MRELVRRVPPERLAALLLVAGAAALLWTGWSAQGSWLVVAAGLLTAGGFVAYMVHRVETRRRA